MGQHLCTVLKYGATLMYCAEVRGNTYATNIMCLVLLQKRLGRLLCRAKRLNHRSRLFYNFCILKVPDIVELTAGTIMLKAYHNILLTYVVFSVSMNLLMQADKIAHLLNSLHVLI